ncbi:MAG: DUF998 domain-containing protein, partial [Candidatus Jordarchaeales archaeon]
VGVVVVVMGEAVERRWLLVCGGSMVASTLVGLLALVLAVALYASSPIMPVYPKFLPFGLTFPCINVGYSPAWQYISELGMGPTAPIFNAGMIVAGLLALPAFAVARRVIGGSLVATLGVLLGLAGCLCLVGVGVFPMSPAFFITNPHPLVSIGFFSGMSLSAALIGYAMTKNPMFSRVHGWLGIAVLIVGVILGVTGDPLPEWAAAVAIIAWFSTLGFWLLAKAFRKT